MGKDKEKNVKKDKSKETEPNDVFNVHRIRRLVKLMKENDLTEIDLQQGDLRIELKKNGSASSPGAYYPSQPQFLAPQPLPVSAASTAPPAAEPVDETHIVYVKSPMVGTFYAAPDPESPPFAKVGDQVHPEKTVCIIEAMKVFNEIQAEASGKIVAILVANGDAVEFGKPLFKIDTRG